MESAVRNSGWCGDPEVCGTMAAYSAPSFSWSKNCFQSGSLQLPVCAESWLIILLQPGQQSSMEAGQSSRGRFSSFLFVRCQMKLQWCLLKASSVLLGRGMEFPTGHAWTLHMSMLLLPAAWDSCNTSWANYWRIPVDENAPNSTGFLWHPLVASPDIQSWLPLPTYPQLPVCLVQSYFQPASEVCTTLQLVPEQTRH